MEIALLGSQTARSRPADCIEAGSLFRRRPSELRRPARRSKLENRALACWRTHRIAKRRANLRRSFARDCSPNAGAARGVTTDEFVAQRARIDARIHSVTDENAGSRASRTRPTLLFFAKKLLAALLNMCNAAGKFFAQSCLISKAEQEFAQEKRFLSRSACRATRDSPPGCYRRLNRPPQLDGRSACFINL